METFGRAITFVNDIVWHPAMLVFLGCTAAWFTIRLKGMQFTRIGDVFKYLFEKGDNKQDTGLSSFQAFAATVGGRVGTGNIAGTATAIFMGGPGALFWMWGTALVGASTGIVVGPGPVFDPETVGIKNENGIWTTYAAKKKARGDYEKEALGYHGHVMKGGNK